MKRDLTGRRVALLAPVPARREQRAVVLTHSGKRGEDGMGGTLTIRLETTAEIINIPARDVRALR